MSKYGETYGNSYGKNELYESIVDFLREYSIVDLLEVVKDAVEYHEI